MSEQKEIEGLVNIDDFTKLMACEIFTFYARFIANKNNNKLTKEEKIKSKIIEMRIKFTINFFQKNCLAHQCQDCKDVANIIEGRLTDNVIDDFYFNPQVLEYMYKCKTGCGRKILETFLDQMDKLKRLSDF